MNQKETLFILRDHDKPLEVGDTIDEAEGMQKYRVTVKELVDTLLVGERVRWEIKGIREAITDKE